MMNAATLIFYLLAALTLGCGVLSVVSRNIFRAAIFLLFSLVGVAGIYFWLQYEFIAAVQIIVYVGGIVVLIIFSIFLTQQVGEDLPAQHPGSTLFAALAAFCGFALLMVQLVQHRFLPANPPAKPVTVSAIGTQLLDTRVSGMALPFEVVSILLLAAMIGSIVIGMRSGRE